jgi:hypothetical protein
MAADSLPASARAILQSRETARLRAARLAHYQRQAVLAGAADALQRIADMASDPAAGKAAMDRALTEIEAIAREELARLVQS